jgi:hypothetical protein
MARDADRTVGLWHADETNDALFLRRQVLASSAENVWAIGTVGNAPRVLIVSKSLI